MSQVRLSHASLWLPSLGICLATGVVEVAHCDVSLSADIFPVFAKKCTECHGDNGGFAIGKSASELYMNLTSSSVTPCDPAATGAKRIDPEIDPASPKASFFYRKIATAECGAKMAIKGRLLPAELDMIRNWITEGAKNN